MKTLNTKLVLSALGLALLASPAFAAQKAHRASTYQTQTQSERYSSEIVPSSGEYGGSYGE